MFIKRMLVLDALLSLNTVTEWDFYQMFIRRMLVLEALLCLNTTTEWECLSNVYQENAGAGGTLNIEYYVATASVQFLF